MLEYPRDYEEAKVIIKNSVNGPVSKHYKKLNLLRSSLITLLGIGAAATIGIIKKDIAFFGVSLHLFAGISLASLYPIFFRKKVDRAIKNGTYFDGKSEEEIMNIARAHVAEYNKLQGKVK